MFIWTTFSPENYVTNILQDFKRTKEEKENSSKCHEVSSCLYSFMCPSNSYKHFKASQESLRVTLQATVRHDHIRRGAICCVRSSVSVNYVLFQLLLLNFVSDIWMMMIVSWQNHFNYHFYSNRKWSRVKVVLLFFSTLNSWRVFA